MIGAAAFGLLGAGSPSPLVDDPNNAYASLILPLAEAAGGGAVDFTDYSSNGFAMSTGAGAPAWSSAHSVPSGSTYGGAAYFSGAANQYIRTPVDTAFQLGTGLWTVRAWYRRDTSQQNIPFMRMGDGTGTYSMIFGYQDGTFQYYVSNNGGSWSANGVLGTIADDTWAYYELGYNGTNLYGSKDGTINSTVSFSGTVYQSTNQVTLMPSGSINGSVQDFVLYKGICLHTSSYTPPTQLLKP